MLRAGTPPSSYTKSSDQKINVVLIPGLFNRWGFYKPLVDGVVKAGFPVYIVAELGFSMGTILESSQRVKKIIEKEKLENVVLLGHSKGGLIGKYLLLNLNSNGRIIKLIAISTPFNGTTLSNHLIYPRFSEFSPNSSLIKSLSAETKYNEKIVNIIPSIDVIIRNKNGSELVGAKNIHVKAGGHNRVVNSEEVINVVVTELQRLS